MLSQMKHTSNRMTTHADFHFLACTKLAIQHELMSFDNLKGLSGGAVVYQNTELADGIPIIAQTSNTSTNGPGPAVIIGLGLAAISAAGAWKEEIYEAVDTVADAVDQFVDSYSRTWDKIWE